jgi:hypothetical protein
MPGQIIADVHRGRRGALFMLSHPSTFMLIALEDEHVEYAYPPILFLLSAIMVDLMVS